MNDPQDAAAAQANDPLSPSNARDDHFAAIAEELVIAEQKAAKLEAERDHLLRRTAEAEALVSMMRGMLHDGENKLLAALVMSGVIPAHEFENRQMKATTGLRDRLEAMRNRARMTANNASGTIAMAAQNVGAGREAQRRGL